MDQGVATTGEEAVKENVIDLYRKLIHSLEQILLKINSTSEDLASLDQPIPGSIRLLHNFIQCDWIIFKDGGHSVVEYAGMIELLYQVITWLFVCM